MTTLVKGIYREMTAPSHCAGNVQFRTMVRTGLLPDWIVVTYDDGRDIKNPHRRVEIVEKLQNHVNPKLFTPRCIYDGTVLSRTWTVKTHVALPAMTLGPDNYRHEDRCAAVFANVLFPPSGPQGHHELCSVSQFFPTQSRSNSPFIQDVGMMASLLPDLDRADVFLCEPGCGCTLPPCGPNTFV